MTAEERFQQIEERHAALAQTVEIMAEMQIKTEKALTDFIGHCDETLNMMARILQVHDQRISGLEDRPH